MALDINSHHKYKCFSGLFAMRILLKSTYIRHQYFLIHMLLVITFLVCMYSVYNDISLLFQGKRGIEKQPFQLPDFIAATGIEKIRQVTCLWYLSNLLLSLLIQTFSWRNAAELFIPVWCHEHEPPN